MPAPKPTYVDGILYPSLTSACRAFGHREPKVRHRMEMGMNLRDALLAKDRCNTGAKRHSAYPNWNAMISRCYSKGSGGYKRYGARGITVCDRWRSDFFTFVHDMGPKPSPRHTVDRINNDLGYGPGNCRWATRVEQGRNRTDNIPIGRYKTIIAASEATGIPACTLGWRKINGWPDDLSLSTAATRSNAHMRQQTKEKAT